MEVVLRAAAVHGHAGHKATTTSDAVVGDRQRQAVDTVVHRAPMGEGT